MKTIKENIIMKSLFVNSYDIIAVIEIVDQATGKYVYVNKGFLDYFGLNESDVINKTHHDIYPPHLAEYFCRQQQRIVTEQRIIIDEVEYSVNGRKYQVVRLSPIFEFEEVAGILLLAIDITGIIVAKEKLLEEKEEQYRMIVNNSPDCILIQVGDEIVFINNAGLKLLGVSKKEEVIGKDIACFFHKKPNRSINDLTDTRIKRTDGAIIDVDIHVGMVRYAGSQAMQLMIRDITDRKQKEDVLLSLFLRRLSLREREVLMHVADGISSKREIAKRMNVDINDVYKYLSRIKSKLTKDDFEIIINKISKI